MRRQRQRCIRDRGSPWGSEARHTGEGGAWDNAHDSLGFGLVVQYIEAPLVPVHKNLPRVRGRKAHEMFVNYKHATYAA